MTYPPMSATIWLPSLEGVTARLGRLQSRLCHVFLVETNALSLWESHKDGKMEKPTCVRFLPIGNASVMFLAKPSISTYQLSWLGLWWTMLVDWSSTSNTSAAAPSHATAISTNGNTFIDTWKPTIEVAPKSENLVAQKNSTRTQCPAFVTDRKVVQYGICVCHWLWTF